MNKNRPPHLVAAMLRAVPLLLGLTLAAGWTHAAEEDVTENDPPRWYQGDDTPQLHYRNLLKEARAAHAEALQECRSLHAKEARSCRQQAHSNYTEDKARAKRILDQLKRADS